MTRPMVRHEVRDAAGNLDGWWSHEDNPRERAACSDCLGFAEPGPWGG